jgi:hypothetical protein
VTVHSTPFSLAPNTDQVVTAMCGAGEKAVGGGFTSNGSVFNFDSDATAADDGWSIDVANGDTTLADPPANGTVHVYCLG